MPRSRRTAALRTSPIATAGPRYVFAEGEPLRIQNGRQANPQFIGEELARISSLNQGHLTPQATVAEARDPNSILHAHFEWRDDLAAEAYRDDQARRLIRAILVVDDHVPRDQPTRAFISINVANGGVSYRTLQEITGNATLQEAVLAAAARDLAAFERRYRELEDVCGLVREARERVSQRRAAATAQSEARPQ